MAGSKTIADGLFITFEGPELSGKSTQATRLAEQLRADGYHVLETREPGGTEIGEELRRLVKHVVDDEAACPEAELFIFSASRAQLASRRILPQLAAGGIVITDRYADSTAAYQGYGRGFDRDFIERLNAVATMGRGPDLTFLLDLPVAEQEIRRLGRPEPEGRRDRFEEEARAFHERVRQGYLAMAAAEPDRFCTLDGARDQEDIFNDIIEAAKDAIARRC